MTQSAAPSILCEFPLYRSDFTSACLTHRVPSANQLLVIVRLSHQYGRTTAFIFDNRRSMAALRESCEAACRMARGRQDTDAQFRQISLFMRCPRKFAKTEQPTSVLLPILFDDLQPSDSPVDQQLRSLGKIDCGSSALTAYNNVVNDIGQPPLCTETIRSSMQRVRVVSGKNKLTERVLFGANRLAQRAIENPYSRKTCTQDCYCNCFIRNSMQSAKAGWVLLYALPSPALAPSAISPPVIYQNFVSRLHTNNEWVLLPATDSDLDTESLDSSASFSSEPAISGADGIIVLAAYRVNYAPEQFRTLLSSLAASMHFCYAQPLRILLPNVRRKRFMERIIRRARALRLQLDDQKLYTLLTAHTSAAQRIQFALSNLIKLPLTTLQASKQLGYDIAALAAYMQLIDRTQQSAVVELVNSKKLCNVWLELKKIDPFGESILC